MHKGDVDGPRESGLERFELIQLVSVVLLRMELVSGRGKNIW